MNAALKTSKCMGKHIYLISRTENKVIANVPNRSNLGIAQIKEEEKGKKKNVRIAQNPA